MSQHEQEELGYTPSVLDDLGARAVCHIPSTFPTSTSLPEALDLAQYQQAKRIFCR